ncbi:bacillithiol biosynthesis cysteine-adding enzyme BshC [Flavobacterium sp. ASW18X]|uniref:bacillithiol biosynthesis cysteine-adding enzyme BshC n=1 Tax=Flavobacterium sp. ASW18X TaxID=2572595 RepID=UPI0010ADF0EC|nr:bacillithiol biosynthesis cysteine-adding enzyme BshC [Flavobacterium sp. ASW18X]TKD62384.1 bacillithiol biosynthesis cysteine-adding enzyme BshC [Flavobacterium sp. ASW18X]
MDVDCIPYQKTGYFSKLICDYISEEPKLSKFYGHFPRIENFEAQIKTKEQSFSVTTRKILVQALKAQYQGISASPNTQANIEALGLENTFTVVTGHQLNLFTGPLYFLYKIISTINLTEELQQKYPDKNFVPVYWMATEDHDFEEINYFNFKGKKIQWNKKAAGPVGRLDTTGLDEVFKVIEAQMGTTQRAEELKKLFKEGYLQHATLTEATRYIVNELFRSYGLVIVDGDDADLKRLLIPYMKADILNQQPYALVSKTINALSNASEDYKIQVNPREINYFYIKDNLRERIVQRGADFFVNDTEIAFSREALLNEMDAHPERFSPNVIARPLYQEVILPNLCYIGGGGELAYWLQLKQYFDVLEVPFPILLPRNSALLITQKVVQKIHKMELSVEDLFLKQSRLINKKIRKISNIDIDFTPQKKALEAQFKALYELAEQTDESFIGAVKAQEVKQKKGLDNLEKRLLKAQKLKLKDHVIRITELQNQLFPNYSLQERQLNFSEMYLEYGDDLITILKEKLRPLQLEFLVLRD